MTLIKKITAICLTFVITIIIALSCKRDDNFLRIEKPPVEANKAIQNLETVGCNNGNVGMHFITPAFAYELIQRYQQATTIPGNLGAIFDQNGWLFFETFPAEAISMVLAQNGCCRFRVYNGLGSDNKMRFIMVGVNEFGYDYLKCTFGQVPPPAGSCDNIGDLSLIVEAGAPCPPGVSECCEGGLVWP
jgi:hypothetical protein